MPPVSRYTALDRMTCRVRKASLVRFVLEHAPLISASALEIRVEQAATRGWPEEGGAMVK